MQAMRPGAPATGQQVLKSPVQVSHGQVVQPVPPRYWVQRPLSQNSSRAHWLPQSPQFAGSVERRTQLLSQSVVPVGHMSWQLPPAQTVMPRQRFPGEPQLSGSLSRSTQDPSTRVRPPRQRHI